MPSEAIFTVMKPRTLAVVVLVVSSLIVAPFAVPVSPQSATGSRAEIVPFDDTVSVGVPDAAVKQAQRSPLVIPKAEVFYSEYRYAVGYYGITSLAASLQEPDHERSLGQPLRVYVSDFSGENVTLTEDNYLRMPEQRTAGWIRAEDAYFVVNSAARIPSRETTVVPFSDRDDAAAFAEEYGGDVQRWDDVQSLKVGRLRQSQAEWDGDVQQRHERANETVAANRAILDRPEMTVVGRDAPSVSAAVEQAPPNTTVVVPPGTYQVESMEIQKPITLRGAGKNETQLLGDETGSVVTATEPRVGIANLSITGVGERRSGADLSAEEVPIDESDWNYELRKVHGYGDAAVVFDSAKRSLVSGVQINTTANGIIARDSPNVTITELTLYGTKRWDDGFLGVAVIGAPAVVQDSEFYGGKVGVYSLDVTGLVVRNSQAKGMMLGVFNYYGRELLVTNNEIDDTGFGIYVEARSYNTAVTENTVTDSIRGIIVAGTANYVSQNVLVKNRHGFVVKGHYSLYSRNVVGYNEVGFRAIEVLPTNRITANDVFANGDPATVSDFNVLQVWRGNYWSKSPGLLTNDDGVLTREYRPTGAVDRHVEDTPFARVVARSPALTGIRQLQRQVAGLQASGIVDPAPRTIPVRAEEVARIDDAYVSPGQSTDDDPWEYHPPERFSSGRIRAKE